MKLRYSRERVLSSISGAIPFQHPLASPIPKRVFPKKKISSSYLKILCEELDPVMHGHSSVLSFLKDSSIASGSKKNIEQELKRIFKMNKKHLIGLLLSFPFKCQVPIKTNYHNLPDLGECMFIYRLGKICKEISKHTDRTFKIHIAEETDALAPVFGASLSECEAVRQKLNQYRDILGSRSEIKFIPLINFMSNQNPRYIKSLLARAEQIRTNHMKYKKQLEQILPTIALSLPTNNLSLKESQELVANFFNNSSLAMNKKLLFDTAFKYLAFNELLNEKKYLSKTSKYLRLSLCPKRGRIGIRPTISQAKILPHHGVPVVYIRNNKKQFKSEYYFDFLLNTLKDSPKEVCDENGDFLYYEVEH